MHLLIEYRPKVPVSALVTRSKQCGIGCSATDPPCAPTASTCAHLPLRRILRRRTAIRQYLQQQRTAAGNPVPNAWGLRRQISGQGAPFQPEIVPRVSQ